jgi:hypothetical protein
MKTIANRIVLVGQAMILGWAVFSGTGCRSTANVEYNPTQTPVYYGNFKNVSVGVGAVTDKRGDEPDAYYHCNNGAGCYAQPVADMVSQALKTELQRAGAMVVAPGGAALSLNCEILDYKASVTRPPFLRQSCSLDLSVVVAFEWRNASTGKILARNEQSERRFRHLSRAVPPDLPFEMTEIHDFGGELLNELLPVVIGKELNTFSMASDLGASVQTPKVVSFKYDANTQHGTLAVDISGHGIEARDWVVNNIAKICSSKDRLLEAGQTPPLDGHYRVLNESVKDNILTIEFSAGYNGN